MKKRNMSLVMIVRDGQQFLARALRSAAPFVREMIVLDTGSTDRSVAIAKEEGARVFHYQWINDFAAARNHALTYATSDWVIWLDDDEWIEPPDQQLISELELEPRHAYACRRINYGQRIFDEYRADIIRIFPKDPGVEWRHHIHELLEDSLLELGYSLVLTDIIIHNQGLYEQDDLGKRAYYRERILEKVRKDPLDYHAVFQYVSECLLAKQYAEAIDGIITLNEILPDQSPLFESVTLIYAKCLIEQYRLADAVEVLDAGIETYPNNLDLLDMRAIIAHEMGFFDEAEALWLRCAQAAETIDPKVAKFNPKRGLEVAYSRLGTFYSRRGDEKTAQGYWRKVLELNPTNPTAREVLGVSD